MKSFKLTSPTPVSPAETWVNPMHVTHWFADAHQGSVVVLTTGQTVEALETPEEIAQLFDYAVNGVPAFYRPPA